MILIGKDPETNFSKVLHSASNFTDHLGIFLLGRCSLLIIHTCKCFLGDFTDVLLIKKVFTAMLNCLPLSVIDNFSEWIWNTPNLILA